MSMLNNTPEQIIHKHHILPRHMGGTDDSSNLILVNKSLHSFLHKLLWEQFGKDEDRLAYLGLSSTLTSEEFKQEFTKFAAKKGYDSGIGKLEPSGKTLEELYGTRKAYAIRRKLSKQKNAAKLYQIEFPDGSIEIVKSLKAFCERSFLNYKSFQKATIGRNKEYKGYKAKKV